MTALHAIRGANYWSRQPVTRMDVHIGAYEEISSADVPTLSEQLIAALPVLQEHHCSVGRRGGFVSRLRTGTYVAHITEHVALALQEMIGHHVGYGRTRGTGTLGEYTLVFEHVHEGVGLRAATLALHTVQQALDGVLETVEPAVTELRAIAKMPPAPPLQRQILCGITGGATRSAVCAGIARIAAPLPVSVLGTMDTVAVDVAPAHILQAGLPYARSEIAVILDAVPTDVPERYRDPERGARLVTVVADVVPHGGWVVCPADAHAVHERVRDGGRQIAQFAPSNDPAEHVRRAVAAADTCLTRTTPVRHA